MPTTVDSRTSLKATVALIDPVVFYSLLLVILLAAIPYGAVEPWWKALFQCLIFALAVVSISGQLISPDNGRSLDQETKRLLLPLLALIALALVQAIPWSSASLPGIGSAGKALSADPFQTWLFVIHLASLVFLAWLLLKHTSTERRLKLLVHVIIVVGILSALFGMLRQARQRDVGFLLPYLRPTLGYGQFVNSNHFAFLMELCLGLALGIVVGRGVAGKRALFYLAAAAPMWVALVLANSRGGILSLLCQVVFLALLWGMKHEERRSTDPDENGRERRARRRSENRLAQTTRMLAIRVILVFALLAGAVATLVLVGGDPLGERLETVPMELDRRTADSATLRQSIWRATWDMIQDRPLAGVGFGGYAVAITKYHRASGQLTPQEAHNDYLELLASGGVVGLGFGIWFLIAFARAAYQRVKSDRATERSYWRAAKIGALAGIFAVCVHSLVDFGLHIPINAWVLSALVAIVLMPDPEGLPKDVPPAETNQMAA